MLGDDYMANKKVEKKLKKYIKKLPILTKVIAVLVFLVSLIGTFGVSFVIQKNDKFELKGEKVDIIPYDANPAKFIENALKCLKLWSVILTVYALQI